MNASPNIIMDRYLVETPHTSEECKLVVDQIYAMGYLHYFEWGCKSGIHSGWAIIEAENETQARMAVPSLLRKKARVIKLNRFSNSEMGH